MPEREPIDTTNVDRYGNPTIPWARPHDLLAKSLAGPVSAFVLATADPQGRPHAAAVGVAWFDGDLYFTASRRTRKARNIAGRPACTIWARLAGMDLTLEGEAQVVDDAATLEHLAAIYRSGGWPAAVQGDAFIAPYSAPTAGPPPWHLHRFRWHTAVGLGTDEPHGASRWRFAI